MWLGLLKITFVWSRDWSKRVILKGFLYSIRSRNKLKKKCYHYILYISKITHYVGFKFLDSLAIAHHESFPCKAYLFIFIDTKNTRLDRVFFMGNHMWQLLHTYIQHITQKYMEHSSYCIIQTHYWIQEPGHPKALDFQLKRHSSYFKNISTAHICTLSTGPMAQCPRYQNCVMIRSAAKVSYFSQNLWPMTLL